MSTITATIQDDTPPWVLLDITLTDAATTSAWSVTRTVTSTGTAVMIVDESSAATESQTLEDHECPFGVAVTYTLAVTYSDGTASESVVSDAVTITGTAGCWLSDPYGAVTAVMQVTLQAWDSRTRAARRSVLPVIGRADPVVISDLHLWGSGTWVLATLTDAATATLTSILTGSGVVLLRTQPASSIPTCYASTGDITETRYDTGSGSDQRRLISVDVQEINAIPATARPLQANLAGLATLGDTLADLADLRSTLLQLSEIRVMA